MEVFYVLISSFINTEINSVSNTTNLNSLLFAGRTEDQISIFSLSLHVFKTSSHNIRLLETGR